VCYLRSRVSGLFADTCVESLIPNQQIFSGLVEQKRYRRTLVAVINCISVPRAIREGLVEADMDQEGESSETGADNDADAMFIPDKNAAQAVIETTKRQTFNPRATSFTPQLETSQTPNSSTSSIFASTNQKLDYRSSPPTLNASFATTPAGTGNPTPEKVGWNSTFNFNSPVPATSTAATSALLFNFGQDPTMTSVGSTPFSTTPPAPATLQFPPTPAPFSFTTSPSLTRQNPAPNTGKLTFRIH